MIDCKEENWISLVDAMAMGVRVIGKRSRIPSVTGSGYTIGRLGKTTSSDRMVDCVITDNNSKVIIKDFNQVELSDSNLHVDYGSLIRSKMTTTDSVGFDVKEGEIHKALRPHQVDCVKWAISGGRRGLFANFGLGKTIMQLEFLRVIQKRRGGKVLAVVRKGIFQEFKEDSKLLDIGIKVISDDSEARSDGIYMTHPEAISRSKRVTGAGWEAMTLDEAAMLRGFGGSETFREFMKEFENVPFKMCATATPSPNNPEELLAIAAFLGPPIMDISTAKTRFFQRDSTRADNLTIYPHKVEEFWSWVASWGLFVSLPSDLGHSDEGYELPKMNVHWHCVDTDHLGAMEPNDGEQRSLFREAAVDLQSAALERRESLDLRISKMVSIIEKEPERHFVLWHDLEEERKKIERSLDGVRSIHGAMDDEDRESVVMGFRNGKFKYVATKPVISAMGVNWQHYCSAAVFVGIGFKFHDFSQALRRIYRSLQDEDVDIHLIYTSAEEKIRKTLERKWAIDEEMRSNMAGMLKRLGLNGWGRSSRSLQADVPVRVEVSGCEKSDVSWTVVNNDCVYELRKREDDSVHMWLTSPPFGNMYKYSENYHDMGHTDGPEHFFEQFRFLAKEMFRTLSPGRIAAIHVKDRIVPSGLTGLGFQTVYRFSDDMCRAMEDVGFGTVSRITVVTDVVRENSQTYRLGWTNKCQDGASKGHGIPEYVLIFRKPPSDRSNGWSDIPVVRSKPKCLDSEGSISDYDKDNYSQSIVPGTGYSRSGWQTDAHGFWRSSGDRMLSLPDDIDLMTSSHKDIFRKFRTESKETIYDHGEHVKTGEELEKSRRLPTGFMLLQPQSLHPEVWTDITRMKTLNTLQSANGREMHVCPMQIDIAQRLIDLYTMPGEIVGDPFGGIGTTPLCAIKSGRKAFAVELSEQYFGDMVGYLRKNEQDRKQMTLFNAIDINK